MWADLRCVHRGFPLEWLCPPREQATVAQRARVNELSSGVLVGLVEETGYASRVTVQHVPRLDVVREGEGGDHTPTVQIGLRYGMTLFIASEVMFFVVWFWAYFNASLAPSSVEIVGGVWPPLTIETFDPWHIPLVNTLILLTSGTTVTWAHHALMEGDRDGAKNALWLTIILGAGFTSLQVYEYVHATFDFSGHIYGSTFFMA